MIMKLIRFNTICFILLLAFNIASFGQNSNFYKQKALECLSNNDCDRAQIMYKSYMDLSKQKDASIEAAIEKCISSEKPDDPQMTVDPSPVVIETFLDVSVSNLSFNEMGTDAQSVTVTSNTSWTISQQCDWIKATITADSTAIAILCEPNISRTIRTDSVIINAGNKTEIIIIEQSGVADPYLVGEQLMTQGQTELAEKYFQLCVNGENVEEWNKLAKLYVDQGGVENYNKAFTLLQKSANSGSASGLCSLGYLYEKGIGTQKDEVAAVKFYTLSAEKKYAPAQYNIGLMFEYGTGVKQDKKEAIKWYEKAAKQGFRAAQIKITSLK